MDVNSSNTSSCETSIKYFDDSSIQEDPVDCIVSVDQQQVVRHDENCFQGACQYHDLEASAIPAQACACKHFLDSLRDEDIGIPFAVAALEPLLQQSADGECSRSDEYVAAKPVSISLTTTSIIRPKFLFVTAIKPRPDSQIGVTFQMKDGGVYISRVDPNGPLHKSGLQFGDRVVSVNKVNCVNATLKMISEKIQNSDSIVSLCVRNKDGDPYSFLNSVQKPTRDCKLGISFQIKNGALRVSKVRGNGLFANSLLMPDHLCSMINWLSCDTMGVQQAADLTASADRVTIISRAHGDIAMVLAIDESPLTLLSLWESVCRRRRTLGEAHR